MGGGDDGATRECLHRVLEDAVGDLRAEALAAVAQIRHPRPDHPGCVNRHVKGTVQETVREVASVQDLRDSVAADVAAERLGRSPHEVRRLLRAGQVCAHRRAGRWFVPVSEVRRLQRLPLPVGRPFSPGSAWALLTMLAGDEPAELSAPRRSQLRRHLLDADSEELAARLGRRARRRFLYAHPSMLQSLAADPQVVLTGLAAAERAGAHLVATDDSELEGYVAEGYISTLSADHGLVDADEVANVVVHVVDDAVEIPVRRGVAAAPVVGLDLWESGDARACEEGQRLFVEALEAFRRR